MTGFKRGIGPAMAVLAFALAAPAGAQENLDQGKSGAQLFAADCAICHKNPQTVAKSGGLLGLSSFLREHYTASRESADMIATYLQSFGSAPASSKARASARPKPTTRASPRRKRAIPARLNPTSRTNPVNRPRARPLGPKPNPRVTKTEPKSDKSEPKANQRPSQRHPEPKSGDAKPDAPKPAEAKASEPKPDKPQKPD